MKRNYKPCFTSSHSLVKGAVRRSRERHDQITPSGPLPATSPRQRLKSQPSLLGAGLGTVCRLADLQISSLLPDAIGLLKAVYSQSFRAVSCLSNTHSLRTYTSSAAFTNGAVVSLANMIEYFVNYSVGVGHFQAGPCDSRAQALIALESIKR